jgi:hypothetical protein
MVNPEPCSIQEEGVRLTTAQIWSSKHQSKSLESHRLEFTMPRGQKAVLVAFRQTTRQTVMGRSIQLGRSLGAD